MKCLQNVFIHLILILFVDELEKLKNTEIRQLDNLKGEDLKSQGNNKRYCT